MVSIGITLAILCIALVIFKWLCSVWVKEIFHTLQNDLLAHYYKSNKELIDRLDKLEIEISKLKEKSKVE